ncbi:MAG: peptidylprolyl isomerase [Bdellovibrionota bacterium]|mgnify:CR=1 FL=1
MTYKASHILVRAKYEAEDLLLKLKSGSNFEDLAKRFSNCTSAANSGNLGELKVGQADTEFEEAVLNLKINEVTKTPVRTRFGYHLIKRLG